MTSICDQLIQLIEQKGSMSFADYMQLALYHPTLGYYQNGTQKFGEKGDFITAPEISPLFGECLANRILSLVPHHNILEFGAGSGQLAVDILSALSNAQALPQHYYILELSAELAHRQKNKIAEKLPELLDKVIWLNILPAEFEGIVIANEVLDAMPVERFCIKEGKYWQYRVEYKDGLLKDQLVPAPVELEQYLKASIPVDEKEDYQSEVNLFITPWLASLSDSMKQGWVILIDYGFMRHEYYHPDRNQGTLMCYYQHHAHDDPYFMPGLQDITAHVDFTEVTEGGVKAGFKMIEYGSQANFLLQSGLMDLVQAVYDKASGSSENTWAVSQAIKKLILPSEMGELFKVMILNKNIF